MRRLAAAASSSGVIRSRMLSTSESSTSSSLEERIRITSGSPSSGLSCARLLCASRSRFRRNQSRNLTCCTGERISYMSAMALDVDSAVDATASSSLFSVSATRPMFCRSFRSAESSTILFWNCRSFSSCSYVRESSWQSSGQRSASGPQVVMPLAIMRSPILFALARSLLFVRRERKNWSGWSRIHVRSWLYTGRASECSSSNWKRMTARRSSQDTLNLFCTSRRARSSALSCSSLSFSVLLTACASCLTRLSCRSDKALSADSMCILRSASISSVSCATFSSSSSRYCFFLLRDCLADSRFLASRFCRRSACASSSL
mmetsp:Transcript_19223/g.72620  ORF Transcript_19223/g.72620 Transcript_19223/m.72620 type:complete len:319 (+) Transcript_19223:207-1163(+)